MLNLHRSRALARRALVARPVAFGQRLNRRALCTTIEDDEVPNTPARHVKIVATIGPASEEAEPLKGCVAAGMNVMRINFSHATKDEVCAANSLPLRDA
jgi:hypothetical protein